MRTRQILKFAPLLILTILSSCKFFGMMRNLSPLNLDVTTSISSLTSQPVTITAEGPDGHQVVAKNRPWGVTPFRGLNEGSWQFTVNVRDAEGVLIGFGVQDIDVLDGMTNSASIDVLDFESGSLTVSIEGLPADVGVGQIYNARGEASGGSGDYRYFWFLGNEIIEMGSDIEIAGTLVLGDYELKVAAFDNFSSEIAYYSFVYSVVSPYTVVEITESQFTISWAAPVHDENVVQYRLYFREHGTFIWESMTEVDATDTLEITVSSSSPMIQPGRWDFGASSIYGDGSESEIHSSLDGNAIPASGWYLDWRI